MATSAADWITAVGTAGAALAAAYAAWKASQSTSASVDLVRIERERLEDERRQREVAELRADARRTRQLTWVIAVINEGPAVAKDVSMFVYEPGSPNQQYRRLKPPSQARTSRERLAPQEELSVETLKQQTRSLAAAVSFAWSDNRGRHARDIDLSC